MTENFGYFSDLMHANTDGLKIYPISTENPLPISTSPDKDKNILKTGNKIRDFYSYRTSTPCPRNAEQTKSTPPEGRF